MEILVDPATKDIVSMVNTTYAMYAGAGTTASPYVANYTPGATEQPIVDLVTESVAYDRRRAR
jgi:hypothetical protein